MVTLPSSPTGNREPVFHPTRFAYPDGFDPYWQPNLPELAHAANAVSLLMPHVEPYVVSSVRQVIDDLDEPLKSRARTYARQEAQHHAQHQRFNDILVARHTGLGRVDRLMAATFRRLARGRDVRFGLAFAAGFETVAYTAARWVEKRRRQLLDGADPEAARLFLWHLAEEVEHKSVAIDVYRAVTAGERRATVRYGVAMVFSALLLAAFSFMALVHTLVATGRVLNPLTHLRLFGWSLTYIFDLLPAMAVSILGDHHPDQLVDPLFYEQWLAEERSLEARRGGAC